MCLKVQNDKNTIQSQACPTRFDHCRDTESLDGDRQALNNDTESLDRKILDSDTDRH